MRIKTLILLTLMSLITLSCNNQKEKIEELESQVVTLKEENKVLEEKLKTLNENFVDPLKLFQESVLNEKERSPDSIIAVYRTLISKYPGSYWKHEAEKRIKKVESNRAYWSEENGWDFSNTKIPPKPKYGEEVISCPGC